MLTFTGFFNCSENPNDGQHLYLLVIPNITQNNGYLQLSMCDATFYGRLSYYSGCPTAGGYCQNYAYVYPNTPCTSPHLSILTTAGQSNFYVSIASWSSGQGDLYSLRYWYEPPTRE